VGALEKMKLSMVHVDDCADGLVRIAERGRDGEEYILGADVVTFREWFSALARVSGKPGPQVYLPSWMLSGFTPVTARLAPIVGLSEGVVREGMAMSAGTSWAFSGEKARRELGWRPRSFEQGLRETMAWYLADRRGGRREARHA
jgi:dihydroflavonol-4-reductase